jgi:glycosyltransferase involved in cell wall biosynthesis
MKTLKILIIGPLPNPLDGCSISNDTLCRNLRKRKIFYQTINTNTKIVSSKQGSNFSLLKAVSFLKVYVECYKIFSSDVIYTTPGQTFFGILKYSPFYLLCKLLGKPYIIHLHGNYLGTEFQSLQGVRKKIFHFLIASANRGIVLSESLRENFNGLLPRDKVFVVENFALNELFDNYDVTKKERNKPVILFLSNLIAEKGILEVLNALIAVKNANIEFKAYVAGKIEKEFEKSIFEKMQTIGDDIEYMGIINGEKKYSVLNSSNIFILPTYYKMEGQPISILEALAMGNIIITTKHAGITDILSDKNGFFVEKKNALDIKNAILEIANDINGQIEKFEKVNIEYAKNNFTEDLFSEKIITIVNGINKKIQ